MNLQFCLLQSPTENTIKEKYSHVSTFLQSSSLIQNYHKGREDSNDVYFLIMGRNKLVHSYDKKENHEWKKWSVSHLLNTTTET